MRVWRIHEQRSRCIVLRDSDFYSSFYGQNNEIINSFLYGYDKKLIKITKNKGESYKNSERTF